MHNERDETHINTAVHHSYIDNVLCSFIIALCLQCITLLCDSSDD